MRPHTILILLFFLASCSAYDIKEVKSGEIKHIAGTGNSVFGTDSTIVIIDRTNGQTLNVIHR
jgi:hypothetical protein